MKTIIHVNQHKIRKREEEPLTVKTYKSNTPAREVYIPAPCLTTDCDRNITPEVQYAAELWSESFGVPYALIAQSDMSPHCSDFVSAVGIKSPHWASGSDA